jgi:uncharacterized protein GlcG (DUF336 family)
MRDLKTLSLTDGKDICNRAVDAAKALGLKVVVVVVDIGGWEVCKMVSPGFSSS